MSRLVVITLGLVFCITASAAQLPDKPHIYVEGSAKIEVRPDVATFTLYLDDVSESAEKSKNIIDEKSIALLSLCKSLGIKLEDIASSGLRVNKEYKYEEKTDSEIYVGVSVSRSVEIILRDISKYKTVLSKLVESSISENIATRLSLSNEKLYTDEALKLALVDATKRAEAIASMQGVKLGKIYSVSEFDLRQSERYLLRVSRKIEGQSSSEISAISSEDVGQFPNSNLAESLQRVAGLSIDPFDSGVMNATAQIYVVFLLK